MTTTLALGLLAMVPTLVAALGLLVIWRAPRRAAVVPWLGLLDLAWCAVSLFAKQAAFVTAAGVEARPSALWGMLLGSVAPALVLKIIPSRPWRAWVSWSVVLLGSLVLLADSVYARWFGDMFPAVALLAVGHIASVAGGATNLVAPRDAWLIVDLAVAAPLMLAISRLPEAGRPRRLVRQATALAGVLVLLVSGWRTIAAVSAEPTIITQRFSNLALVAHTGPLAFHAVDGWLLLRRSAARELVSEATFSEVQAWFDERRPLRADSGPRFGVAAGMNLVVIQVESLQAPIVELRIDGHEVMPNLRRLQEASWSFSQVFDQTDEGRTSDAEWLGLTSLLPEPQGAAVFLNAANQLVRLPSLLALRGYHPLSAVAFVPSFWNRRVMYPKFGFATSLFAADFGPGEHIGWGLNDRDFLLQMVPRLEAADRPFAAWLVTLSLHYPFEAFPDHAKRLDVGAWRDTAFGNYLHGMHFFDQALGGFLSALERDGLLARTVVVVTGDHSAGFPWAPELAHALGFSNDLAQWTFAERVPLVIRVPGGRPERLDMPAGQVDLAPSLLGLLGIDAAGLPFVGRNLFGTPGHEPVVRRDGSWVDADHLFLLRGKTTGTHCFDRPTLVDVPLAECAAGSALASRQVEISRRVREFDLQKRLLAAEPAATPR